MGEPWWGIDLDGTLATYHGFKTDIDIGPPVPAMLNRVKMWIKGGRHMKIFTSRAGNPRAVQAIKNWLVRNGLPPLDVTNKKDKDLVGYYDDKAHTVETNTGRILS